MDWTSCELSGCPPKGIIPDETASYSGLDEGLPGTTAFIVPL